MDTIESLNKYINEMKSIISRDDVPNQIIDMYSYEIEVYEAKKVFLSMFGE